MMETLVVAETVIETVAVSAVAVSVSVVTAFVVTASVVTVSAGSDSAVSPCWGCPCSAEVWQPVGQKQLPGNSTLLAELSGDLSAYLAAGLDWAWLGS